MEEKMKKLKVLTIVLLLIFLSSSAIGQQNKITNAYFQSTGKNLKVIFEGTTGFEEIPDFFENKGDTREIVLRFKNAFTDKNEIAGKGVIEKIKFEEKNNGELYAHLFMKTEAPFRIYKSGKKVIMEIYKTDASIVPSSNEEKNETLLQFLKVNKEADGNSQIILTFNNDVPTYDVFYVENPRRLVFDLFDTRNRVRRSSFPISSSEISRVRVGQNKVIPQKITRLVFDLKKNEINYSVDEEGNSLIINIKEEKNKIKIPQNNLIPEKKIEKEKIRELSPQLTEKKKIKIENKTNRIKVVPIEKANTKKFEAKTLHSEENVYKGALISLRLKDADIRDVLREIAIKAGLNLIIDPGITGKVTCELIKIPWDQALDLILKSNKLGKVLEGNVLRVGKTDVLAREEEENRKLMEAKKLSGPVKVLTRTLSYARVKNVRELLKSQLSKRGQLLIDERTNTVIISDVVSKVQVIDKMIDILDTPNLQVNIKARIVETTSNYARNLGIQWGFKGVSNYYYGNQTSLQFPNNFAVAGNSVASQQGIYGPLGGYAVNLPAPAYSSGIGITLGNVLDTFRLDAALTALENKGKAKILSMPEVTTQDNMKAEVIQGKMIPVQTVAYNTVSTRYVNAALELHVTPHITAEGTIIMNIEIKNDNADFSNLVNGIPPIITQSAKTSVLVKDGGTTVIGGIYKVEDSVTKNSVPGLGKIPIIGFLFRGTQRVGTNRELLIFITPRIVR